MIFTFGTGGGGGSGATGATGPTGASGPTGPTGATGPAGATGATGPSGVDGGAANIVWNEIPAGTINGINDTFTISATPDPFDSLELYKNGLLLIEGDDYTLAASTITFSAPQIPSTGDLLVATFQNGTNTVTGATGATGPTGASGPTGATGASGATGPTGTSGLDGTDGSPGAIGPSGPTGATGAAANLTTVDYTLSGDVTMTNADQFYDGPAGSFTAGTWLVNWRVLLLAGTSQTEAATAKLWDGTNVYDEMEVDLPALPANSNYPLYGFAIITLGSTQTLKVSVISARSGQIIQRDVDYNSASTHTASRLIGVQVA